jgi:hypothetical protein
METVDFSRIPNEMNDAADFLKGHIQGRVRASKHQLLVEGPSHKELKLLLHKFLRHKQLDEYRVLSQSGIMEIVPEHAASHDTGSKSGAGTIPPASVTMPYYFPGGTGAISASKKVKKRKT